MAKVNKLTELEQKRRNAKKALPDIRNLIKKHGFEIVNYVWQKVIAKERQVAVARAKASKAIKEAEKLEKQLGEEL